MTVDRKSDHYTSPDNYKALDGNIKSFTYVDHDRHTSRLKVFSYDKKEKARTPLQELADRICEEGINTEKDFINDYDTILAVKYEFERYRKGRDVSYISMDSPYRDKEWYNDLNELYGKYTKNKLGSKLQKGSSKKNS